MLGAGSLDRSCEASAGRRAAGADRRAKDEVGIGHLDDLQTSDVWASRSEGSIKRPCIIACCSQ